ncbi:hypothetical protein [Pelagicoccus mobilis]|uniref:DUF4380 domain-containing protein n=1 Tax=Pelagicoccus mobilis TaxID=415221 RepID=A0A934RZV0_9BACT|nr:hypothetical protein [Pelagicoccus mobilis]MBK1876879.1 hypothetical protein [Pelagicoccus mobilis]
MTTQFASWESIIWNGEKAYQSAVGGSLAIVSPTRGRLVHFGSYGTGRNLLYSPTGLNKDFGGHRFWLGPQRIWNWPPPIDWERSQANCHLSGEALTLELPHTAPQFPRITRRYFWSGSKLACSCEWQPSATDHYAMHVLAVPRAERIKLRIQKSDSTPHGYLTIGLETNHPTSSPAIRTNDQNAIIDPSKVSSDGVKLGFPVQTICFESERGTLSMEHGIYSGLNSAEIDSAYRSQIWCSNDSEFTELEQISPVLEATSGEKVSHTIYLSATA